MAIAEALLAEFDHEMGTTRRLLERVAEDRLAWKPHPKSMSMGALATHLANLPHWCGALMDRDSFDLESPEARERPKEAVSRAELLSRFDAEVASARQALASKNDAEYMASWSLKRGAQVMFSMPRIGAVRTFVMSHTIHHRGQLSVYLRLNDIPVPAIYGPSADEG